MKTAKRFCVYSENSDNVLVIYKTIEMARMGRKLASQMYPNERIKLGSAKIEIL